MAVREPRSGSGWTLIVAAAIGIVAMVFGIVGLSTAGEQLTPFDVFYKSLQLFVLEGDGLPMAGTEGSPWLEGARILAPLATFLTVFVALRELLSAQWRRWWIEHLRGHSIVCGDDAAAIALARNLSGESKKRVVLVRSTDLEPVDERMWIVNGDPRQPATLAAAGVAGARILYACAEHSAANAAVAVAAGRLRADPRKRLLTYAQVRSEELVEALRVLRIAAERPDAVPVDFFALDDIAARVLLDLHRYGAGAPLVLGFGPLGRALLKAILRRPGASPTARVVFVASGVASVVAAEAVRLDAAGHGWEVRSGGEDDGDGPAYVCLDDEDDAVATGLRLARTSERTVVVCLRRASPFREALAAQDRLKVFGVLDEACTEDAIVEDSIVARAARAIHERYRRDAIGRGDTDESNPSVVEWRHLPPHLQESNRAQAEHVGAKLLEIGAKLSTRRPSAPFAFTEAEVNTLARMEHVRWMEERHAAGFRLGPRREGMWHPDLVDWPDLSTEGQQKDIDAVRHLPDLLAAEGLYIERGRPS